MNNFFEKYKLPKLHTGSTIGIMSPSCPLTYDAPYPTEIAEIYLKAKGFKIIKGSLYGKTDSCYRSGTIKERAEELNELIHNDKIDCIMASVGGYVSVSMLPYIDYEYLKKNPKIIVGHSDVTSLLLAINQKCGFPTFYGPNLVTSFAHKDFYQKYALDTFLNVINHTEPYIIEKPQFYTDESTDWYTDKESFNENLKNEREIPNEWKTVIPGKARGRLIGGNIDTFSLLYGNPYCPEVRKGDILFLENINENADSFERYISSLYTHGIFEKISGLILGKPKGYKDIGSGKGETDILSEIISKPEFPILADVDCGHTVPIITLPIGAEIEIDSDKKAIKIL